MPPFGGVPNAENIMTNENDLRGVCHANQGSRITGPVRSDLGRFDWLDYFPYVNARCELTGDVAKLSPGGNDFVLVSINDDGTPGHTLGGTGAAAMTLADAVFADAVLTEEIETLADIVEIAVCDHASKRGRTITDDDLVSVYSLLLEQARERVAMANRPPEEPIDYTDVEF